MCGICLVGSLCEFLTVVLLAYLLVYKDEKY